MQIEIDTEILETIFTHATTAARLAGYLDDPIAVDGTIVDRRGSQPRMVSSSSTSRFQW